MGHRFLEQLPHVLIVQLIEDLPPRAASPDKTQVAKDSELVRDSRCLHPDVRAQLGYGGFSFMEAPQDPQATRRTQSLHRFRDLTGNVGVQ